MSAFRTLISQIRPVEVIYDREIQNSDVLKILKNSQSPPVLAPMPPKNCWSFMKTV